MDDRRFLIRYEYAINLSGEVSNADVEEVCFTFSRRVEELRRKIAAKVVSALVSWKRMVSSSSPSEPYVCH